MTKESGQEKGNNAVALAKVELQETAVRKPHCGIVMPISEIDGCPVSHWVEVKSILVDAIAAADFTANLVSEANYSGTILREVIQHLHDDPLIVCDVSGKNANVMFELGMRLAFDKPTIIVKDYKTDFSFDIGGIRHLNYPRDLRFPQIVAFKEELGAKVRATYEEGKKPGYTTFLKHFGTFTVAKLETKEVSKEQFIIDKLAQLQTDVRRLAARDSSLDDYEVRRTKVWSGSMMVDSKLRWSGRWVEERVMEILQSEGYPDDVVIEGAEEIAKHVLPLLEGVELADRKQADSLIREMIPHFVRTHVLPPRP